MKMRIMSICSCVLVLWLSTAAQGATFQWRDDQGVTHFTDNPDRIPARFTSRARELPSAGTATKEPASAPAQAGQEPGGVTAPAVAAEAPEKRAARENAVRMRRELAELEKQLSVKKGELAKLRRAWTVRKGRVPTAEEIEKFEKKRAAGEVKLEDNPFVSRNTLTPSGKSREAYYRKLEEVKGDEERVKRLKGEIEALER